MFHAAAGRRRFAARKNRRAEGQPRMFGARRFALESLEPRQMLSAAPLTFRVVDDASADKAFAYAAGGAAQGSTNLAAGNSAPRGIASAVAAEKTWVVDANRNVYVYNAAGALVGSWSAGSLASNAAPEGIATDGTDVWIVDAQSDKAFRYAGAASRLSGSQNAASSFNLDGGNKDAKDLVTDGASLWVVNDSSTDKVFKYTVAGSLLGSWTIASANSKPAGIALDPANVGDLWIADSGTDRVYKYAAAVTRTSGSQAAAASFALASGNGNSQGLVVPGRPWAETPYEVAWIRQFGTPGADGARGVTVDGAGRVIVSGTTTGALASANPSGLFATYLAKYDASGNLNWMLQKNQPPGVEGGGVRVVTDANGNIFQVMNIVSGSAAATLDSYDSAGVFRWSTPIPAGESMFDVTVDVAGNVYTSSYEGNNLHVRKFNGAIGSILWADVRATGGYTNSSSLSADRMGSVYVTAYTSGSLLGPYAGGYDALVLKYTETGQLLWSRQYGSAGIDYAFYAEADAFGNVYSGGRTDGSLAGPSAGGFDVFLAKHDGAGNLLWKNQWGASGDDTRADMWVDPQGNVYRAIETTAALGGARLGARDIVVVKVDPQGNILWATQVGTNGDEDAAGGIWGDAQGNLYVTGVTTGSWGGPHAGNGDAYVMKLTPPQVASADLAVTLAAPSAGVEGDLTTFNITVANNGPTAAAGVVLTDTLGVNWLFSSATASQGTFSQTGGVVTFTLGALAAGQSAAAQVTARAVAPGSFANTASVASATAEVNPANNSATRTVSVAAAPIVASGPITVSGKKQNNIATATFTHANGVHPASYYTATINWGDGTTSTGTITQSGSTYTVKGSKTYAKNGTYTVTTSVVRAAAATSSLQTVDLAFAAMAWEASQLQGASDAATLVRDGKLHRAQF